MPDKPRIVVVGIGGGGCNAINRMMEIGIKGVDFIGINTDKQALSLSLASTKICIGKNTTRGLGAEGNILLGQKAAEESADLIHEIIKGANIVFITAGLGGGTGSGASPIVARIAKESGAVTIAIVSTPFSFEVGRRQKYSEIAIANLKNQVDTLVVIPNDRLLQMAPRNLPLDTVFRISDDYLRQAVQGIAELVTSESLINIDVSDIISMMSNGGATIVTVGNAKGENRAKLATEQALSSVLLVITLDRAKNILVNVTGGENLNLYEVNQIKNIVRESSHHEANILLGSVVDPKIDGELRVTIIANGFEAIPIKLINKIKGMKLKQPYSTKLNIYGELMPETLLKSISPFTNALVGLQRLIDEIRGLSSSKAVIQSIISTVTEIPEVQTGVLEPIDKLNQQNERDEKSPQKRLRGEANI